MIRNTSFLFILWTLVFFTHSTAAANPAKQEIQKAYYNWCSSVAKAKGNAQEMVQYYAPDAILLPTLSPEILLNSNGGLDPYFRQFTSHKNIKCTTEKLITRFYGDLVAVNVGLYSFSFIQKNGKPQTLLARFTFVYEKHNNHWFIVSHHSSLRPA